jgi:hypothetical protein
MLIVHPYETEKRNSTMGLFPKSPEKVLIRDIDVARANRDRLAAKLFEAETSVTARRSQAQQLAYDDADGAVLARAQTALQAALGDVGTFGGALAKATALLAKLEGEHAELVDKRVRTSTAAEVAELATDLETTGSEVIVALAKMTTLAGSLARFNPDAVGLHTFLESSGWQIGPAVELVAEVTRLYARQVLEGSVPATLPQSTPAPALPAVVAQPTTRHVFSVRNIKWSDEAGLRVLAAGFECDLPPAAAERGLKTGAVTLIGSNAWRTLKGTRPITHPAPGRCESLDDGDHAVAEPNVAAQSQHEPTLHSGFTETIGQPRLMRVGGTS